MADFCATSQSRMIAFENIVCAALVVSDAQAFWSNCSFPDPMTPDVTAAAAAVSRSACGVSLFTCRL